MKKRIKRIVLLLAAVCVVLFAMPYAAELTDNKSEYGEAVTVEIPKGASTAQIGEILKENGLVKSALIFKLRAYNSENASKMNYGTFELYRGMCIPDIIDTLAGEYAHKETMTLTVPEGYSAEWIAREVERVGLCAKDDFLKALEDDYDYDFVKEIPVYDGLNYRLQGYLYPKTYEFYADATAHEIVDKMLAQFEKETKNVVNDSKMSMHEIVTLASLLEREALLEKEYATISGVIYNRLEKGMKLQIDASVQYVISDGLYDKEVKKSDYSSVKSPYSTYQTNALPIGPICNPSIKTIEAAIQPEKHEYLYYHTDTAKNDGSHIFTKTYDEHKKTQKK